MNKKRDREKEIGKRNDRKNETDEENGTQQLTRSVLKKLSRVYMCTCIFVCVCTESIRELDISIYYIESRVLLFLR